MENVDATEIREPLEAAKFQSFESRISVDK
jgi:hypothetical protein